MQTKRMISNFLDSRAGNVAMMFGLLAAPLVVAAGIGVDMARAGEARARVAEASVAALLAAARAKVIKPTMTDTEAAAVARRQYDLLVAKGAPVATSGFAFAYDPATQRFSLSTAATIETVLVKLAGFPTMQVGGATEAKLAPPRKLELALALDNTYSMTGSKLTSLKSAANNLVDTLMVDGRDNVKIAVTPFSQYVNVGLSRRYEPWIDVPEDSSVTTTNNVCYNTYPDRTETNCRTWTDVCSSTRDGVTTTWSCTRRSCDVNNGAPVRVCEDRTTTTTTRWYGCVGSRNYPFNVKDEQYSARKVPGLPNIGCPNEVTPLTNARSTVKNAISAMAVQGDQTYIPAGLVWACRMVSNIEPFTEGATYEDAQRDRSVKAVVLMTDGVNTKSAQYPYHTRAGGIDADRIMLELCDDIKGKGIRLYTIAFEVTDTSVRDNLQSCASSASEFYNATDATALSDAFEQIGLSLTQLALTK